MNCQVHVSYNESMFILPANRNVALRLCGAGILGQFFRQLIVDISFPQIILN
jgi:hypothetical protein